MKKLIRKPIRGESLAACNVLLYARVSSKEQEKEGFSIPAQRKILRDYAQDNKSRVVHEYVDVKTAKQVGGSNFGEMVQVLTGKALDTSG